MRFADWLRIEMEKRGLGVRDLAGLAYVEPSTISRALGEERGPGPELCQKLARALDLPEIVVFVQAGLMSQTTNPDELTLRELYRLLSALPPDDQRAILAEARARYQAAPSVRTAPDCASS